MKARLCIVFALLFIIFASPLRIKAQDSDFPPIPDKSSLEPFTRDEQDCGVVGLYQKMEFSGNVKGFWKLKGRETRKYRERYYVINSKGIESIKRHILIEGEKHSIVNLKARTIGPDGKVYEVDPDKDIVSLDSKTVEGETEDTTRAIMFPHVEAGSVLDLRYDVESNDFPEFELIPLQGEIPVRKISIKVRGLLFKEAVAWVPFFLGPVPDNAWASLDNKLNLKFTMTDAERIPDEPYSPPDLRTHCYLGLKPANVVPLKKAFEMPYVATNAAIFGRASHVRRLSGDSLISEKIQKNYGIVCLDKLGLQKSEGLSGSGEKDISHWLQEIFQYMDKKARKFMDKGNAFDDNDTAESVAPSSLPVRERVKKLVAYAKSKVRIVPEADSQKKLRQILSYRRADEYDFDLYVMELLKEAGIDCRLVYGFSTYSVPLQPILRSLRPYVNYWFIEIMPAGEPSYYIMPGDIYASIDTFPYSFLGALAYYQPDYAGDSWILKNIPVKLKIKRDTAIDCSADLPVNSDTTKLKMHTALLDSAAYSTRVSLGRKKASDDADGKVKKKREKYFKRWLSRWTGAELEGDVPDPDTKENLEDPFTFDLSGKWQSGARKIGERMLVSAFPDAYLLTNPFKDKKRTLPVWLVGGHYKLSMTWLLPEGWQAGELPKSIEAYGPSEMHFWATFSKGEYGEDKKPGIRSDIIVDLPYKLNASSYAEVQTFFQKLERAGKQKLMVIVEKAETGEEQ